MAIPMRSDAIKAIYFRNKLIHNFDWDGLVHYPISAYLNQSDIASLNYIAVSAKLGGTSKKKKIEMMKQILGPKGFIYMTAGTNRVVFRCDFDQSFLLKIAMDDVGVRDSAAEKINHS